MPTKGVTGVFRFPTVLSLLLLLAQNLAGQETGTVAGTVLDAANGSLVRPARVEVEGRPELSTVTDLDGVYFLQLPPGTYQLLFTADNYHESTVSGIVVTPGAVQEVSTVMANVATQTVVDVTADIDAVTATAEAMLTERKLAPTVSDSMSRDEIRKSVASDAAGAVEKVTGVSVVDGGYVYVRGLGERYSATMLNRAMVPTTDPERRVVPLDLFPATLIENIKVIKTYAPDMPGEFSGGLVQMQTIEFPVARTFNAGMSYGFNSRTTFKEFQSYRGGESDFWGYEDGSREVPVRIPQTRLFPGSFSRQEMQEFGRAFPVNWEGTSIDSARPSQTWSFAGGDTLGPLGLVGALTFTNKPQIHQEARRYLVNTGGGNIGIRTDYPDFARSVEASRVGAVFNAALRLNHNNKIVFRNTYTHDADKEARRFEGLNGADGVAVFMSGGRTYAMVTGFGWHFEIIDLTDPASPEPVSIARDGKGGFEALSGAQGMDVFESGARTYAIVAGSEDFGVQIADITDPAKPIPVSAAFDDEGGYEALLYSYDVKVYKEGGGIYAVVSANYEDGIQLIDVTDPASPAPIDAAFDDAGGFTALARPMYLDFFEMGGRTYAVVASQGERYPDVATDGDGGIQIIDVSAGDMPR